MSIVPTVNRHRRSGSDRAGVCRPELRGGVAEKSCAENCGGGGHRASGNAARLCHAVASPAEAFSKDTDIWRGTERQVRAIAYVQMNENTERGGYKRIGLSYARRIISESLIFIEKLNRSGPYLVKLVKAN